MTRTLLATFAKPVPRAPRGTVPAKPARRPTLALVENALRLLMWTVVALFTLLLAVVIALG
ncbi:MAG TPA: hypothetical protein VF274_10140 [Alphaproteobacteria bacterium]